VLVASINNLPVATLEKANAGENQNVFFSRQLISAIKHSAKKVGAEKALSSFGFELAKVNIPVGNIVAKRVDAKLAEHKDKLQASVQTLSDDYEQALSLAMAALTKGFYRNRGNAVRDSLVQELSAANVRNPGKLVYRVFASAGMQFNKDVLELAKELLSKSVDHRNELAGSLGEMAPKEAEEEEDSIDEGDDFEDKLEGASIRPSLKTQEAASASKGSSVADLTSHIRKLNGGRIF
jgi:hypothetical protein